jgi:hypothetical protein
MKKHVLLTKFFSACVLLFMSGSLAWMGRMPALAADAEVSVQVFPATLVIPALDSIKALLVIQNPTTDQLANIEISYFPQDKISIEIVAPATAAIPAGSAATWELKVRRNSGILTTANVFLVIQYEREPAGAAAPIPDVKVVPLVVTATGKAPDKSLLAASTKMTDATVMEKHPGLAYLVLQNTTGEPLSIDLVEAKADPALVVTKNYALPVVLGPFDQIAIPYNIELRQNSSIQPGKILILFNVTAHAEESQQQVLAAAIQEVNVGVLGENSLLTLLGVPSLLVLPGFLMVATFLMLWRLKYGSAKIEAKSADFWLIAITLSILAAVGYPPLTSLLTRLGLMEQPRNILTGYGLVDILALWIASIILAALVFLGTWAIRDRIAKNKAKELAAKTPDAKDTEYTILVKLARQGLGAVCGRVKVITTSDETLQGFLLKPWSEKPDDVWIGPAIKLVWKTTEDAFKDPIKALLGGTTAPELKKLAELLLQGKDKYLTMEWSTDSSLKKPRQVLVKTIQKLEPSMPIVRQDLE